MTIRRDFRFFRDSAILSCAVGSAACSGQTSQIDINPNWAQLPAVPDREGFASPFAGVAGGALLIAGGANFPGKRPWEGGVKVWYDTVFALAAPGSHWIPAGWLPRPNAYGVSVTFAGKIICAGGGNAREHFREVFALTWNGRALGRETLPSLPRPCAFMCGAVVGNTLYLAGGVETPDAVATLKTFWALDLIAPGAMWRELPSWPGPAREQAVAAAAGDTFYLFSGHDLGPGPDGKPMVTYLRDAYAYTAARGWRRLADQPRATEGAMSPAPVTPNGWLLAISGDDGTRVLLNGPNHPGFPHDVLAYDPAADRWKSLGKAPFSRCNAATVYWHGHWIMLCGERMPGYRSNEVWSLVFPDK